MHQLESVERLVRAGIYMGPFNHEIVAIGGGMAGRNPFDMIMKIGTWYDSADETLLQLGLPPNRKEGRSGFLGYATDGKLHAPTPASDSHALAV